MLIGVPKEIKGGEYRVGMMPEGVATLASNSHRVLVQHSASQRMEGFARDLKIFHSPLDTLLANSDP